MTFTSVLENIARSPITTKIGEKLKTAKSISLSGLSRLGKGLVSTQLCQQQTQPLLIVTATVEEATRLGFTTPIHVMARLSISTP